MRGLFMFLVLGLLLSGITYGQPDLSDRIQPLPVEYDVGCEYITVCPLSYICVPCEATNIDPLVGGNELFQFGNATYGLARSCGWTIYTFLTLSNPLLPCYEPDEFYGLCRTQTTNAPINFYQHAYGLIYISSWPSELV